VARVVDALDKAFYHPAQALREYREHMGIAAKLVVVAMASNGFSIADPDDAGMLEVVGFDTMTPGVLAEFITSTVWQLVLMTNYQRPTTRRSRLARASRPIFPSRQSPIVGHWLLVISPKGASDARAGHI
jgi:hypothetical protein